MIGLYCVKCGNKFQWIFFLRRIFSGMKSSTTWLGNVIAQSPRKMSLNSKLFQWFIMVYQTIIGVNFHIFIICNDLWCQLPFYFYKLSVITEALFSVRCLRCVVVPGSKKLRGTDTTILGQHRPFMSIKLFIQHSWWQEMVSLCWIIRLIGVCADRDQPEFLCTRSDSRHLEVHVATAGGWLTRYGPRKVRNSIYRSKFLYRFI